MSITQTVSKRMTTAEWDSIRERAMADPERLRIFAALAAVQEKMGKVDYLPDFRDCDTWENLMDKLLQREWQILTESRTIVRPWS